MINTMSLFCGAGGLDMGFEKAGFNIVFANDMNKDACDTYEKNFNFKPICDKLENIQKFPSDIDLIVGGPPCQGFSGSGKKDPNDPRSQLVWTYLKVISEVKPKMFVMENVMEFEIAKDKYGKNVMKNLIAEFSKLGYTVNIMKLNAANYGVPQLRKRIFIVGTLENIFIRNPFITHFKWVSAKEALDDLGTPTENGHTGYRNVELSDYARDMRNKFKTTDHYKFKLTPAEERMIPYVSPGGNYMDIPDEVATKRVMNCKRNGGRTTNYMRLHPDRPSYTVNAHFNTMNVGSNVHYREDRIITVREGMRLQSFPDDFELVATSKVSLFRMVGNAVPPKLSYQLARHLKTILNEDYIMADNLKNGF